MAQTAQQPGVLRRAGLPASWIVHITLNPGIAADEAEFYRRANEDFLQQLCRLGIVYNAFATADFEYFLLCEGHRSTINQHLVDMPSLSAEIAAYELKELRFAARGSA